MKTSELCARKGIGEASNGIQFFRDLKAAAGMGSLENHVLNEMGNPVFPTALVPGTGLDPNPHRNGVDIGDFLRDYLNSIIQSGLLDHGFKTAISGQLSANSKNKTKELKFSPVLTEY